MRIFKARRLRLQIVGMMARSQKRREVIIQSTITVRTPDITLSSTLSGTDKNLDSVDESSLFAWLRRGGIWGECGVEGRFVMSNLFVVVSDCCMKVVACANVADLNTTPGTLCNVPARFITCVRTGGSELPISSDLLPPGQQVAQVDFSATHRQKKSEPARACLARYCIQIVRHLGIQPSSCLS